MEAAPTVTVHLTARQPACSATFSRDPWTVVVQFRARSGFASMYFADRTEHCILFLTNRRAGRAGWMLSHCYGVDMPCVIDSGPEEWRALCRNVEDISPAARVVLERYGDALGDATVNPEESFDGILAMCREDARAKI